MYSNRKKGLRLSFNAPVTLVFSALCLIACVIIQVAGESAIRSVFSVYSSSLRDPMTYVRCVTHVLGHAGWDHLIGNMMFILLLGPMIEEKYGSKNTVLIIVITAAVTGIINMVFFPRVALLGASGVVFAFILISSVTVREDNTIPVTFILVALLYLGREIYDGIFVRDNVSQMAHIIGGAVGSVLGFLLSKTKKKDRF